MNKTISSKMLNKLEYYETLIVSIYQVNKLFTLYIRYFRYIMINKFTYLKQYFEILFIFK